MNHNRLHIRPIQPVAQCAPYPFFVSSADDLDANAGDLPPAVVHHSLQALRQESAALGRVQAHAGRHGARFHGWQSGKSRESEVLITEAENSYCLCRLNMYSMRNHRHSIILMQAKKIRLGEAIKMSCNHKLPSKVKPPTTDAQTTRRQPAKISRLGGRNGLHYFVPQGNVADGLQQSEGVS